MREYFHSYRNASYLRVINQTICTLGQPPPPSFSSVKFSLNAQGPPCKVGLQICWNVSCSLLNTRTDMPWSHSEIFWYISWRTSEISWYKSWRNSKISWYEPCISLMDLNAHGHKMINHKMG